MADSMSERRSLPGEGSAFWDDGADIFVADIDWYDKSEPVNLGSAFEINIKDWTEMITR